MTCCRPPGEVTAIKPDFLGLLKRQGVDGPLPRPDPGGTAAHGLRADRGGRSWEIAFATGIEFSKPLVANPHSASGHLRRDLLEESGHYRYFREDLALVKERGTPCLRYGLPNHRIHLGPDRYE